MPIKTLLTTSMRSTLTCRVISGSVVCKGWHQQTNTNAVSKQKRMKDQHFEDSCGRPKMHGIPCVHMVAVTKSCRIEGLNPVNAITTWWMTVHWHKQYPQGADLNCNFDIQMLKNTSWDTTWRYGPPYTALNKAGRPKNNKRLNLAIEVASEQYSMKKITSLMET